MSPTESADLSHAAQIARGRVEDPDEMLGSVMRRCSHLLEVTALADVEKPKTELQARWKAPFSLDLGNIRSELKLRMRAAERRAELDTSPSGP